MQKYISSVILTITMMFVSASVSRADYSNTVMTLHPVAYWPLNETIQPPVPYLATNSGAWGAMANGYYSTWFATNSTGKMAGQMSWSGPVAGATSDGDMAAGFDNNSSEYILIPHTYTNTIIHAPFSVECWVYTQTNKGWVNLVAAGGQTGTSVDNNGNEAGFSLDLYDGSFIFDLFNTNGNNHSVELSVPNTYGQWSYLVATYDGTNAIMYLNGSQQISAAPNLNGAGLGYVPDTINPMEIGILNFAKYINTFAGAIDEVAIYTNVLTPSDVATHFNTATSGGYYDAVMNNNPVVYLRLDEPVYNLPSATDFTAFPQAVNYGSIGTGANGLYEPGTIPGMSGPTGTGFGSDNNSVLINNLGSGVDVGNGALATVAPELNVTGTNSMSVITWFKGKPADVYNRFQGLVGHGDSGWRFGYGGDGPHFNPGAGGEISSGSANNFNDGFWHMATGVYDGKTNYLYIDNALVSSTPYSGSQSGNNLDVLLGGAPDYVTPIGVRGWDGNLAQVAFFTNALSTAEVQQLYLDAGIYPYFRQQPISAIVNEGSSFTNRTVVGGSPTIAFQWYKGSSILSDQTNSYLSLYPVQSTDAGNYYLVAANSSGAVTSSVVNLSVLTSPEIQQEPAGTNFVFFPGMPHTITVGAIGAEPRYYYWLSNNVVVAETTNYGSYTAVSYDSANYKCVVSNYLGSVSSSAVSITVLPTPTNNYPLAVLGDTPIAYWRMGEVDTGYPNNGVVAYDNVGGHNGVYTNTTLGQPGYPSTVPDPNTTAYFGDPAALDSDMQVVSGIDFATNGNAEFSVEAWVYVPAADLSYVQGDGSGIITKGTGSGGEQFNLDTGSSDSSGNPAFRFFVRDSGGGVHLANSSVTVGDGNWHHVVGVCDEAKGKVSLYVDGVLAAADSSLAPGSGLQASSNPLSIGARQSGTTAFDNQFPGDVDEVAIYNYPLSTSQVQSHYNAAIQVSAPPTITQQPPSGRALTGTTIPLSVTAEGTGPFHYQWYLDGVAVGTDTNVFDAAILSGSHSYYCEVTGALGTTDSMTNTITSVALTDSGTNTDTSITSFAVNFMDAENGAYTPDNANTWINVVYQGMGAYPDEAANTNWNGFGLESSYFPSFDSSMGPQLASDGTLLTPVTLSLYYTHEYQSSTGIYFGPGYGANTSPTDPSLMLGQAASVNSTYPGIGSSGTPLGGIAISNVPPGTYKVYLYGSAPDNDYGAAFSLSSGVPLGGTNETINANDGIPPSNYIYGVNYVIYTNVVPDASGAITGTWGTVDNPISGQSGEGDFNGLQLVRVSGPPSSGATVTISMIGQQAVITWSPTNGVLQSASSVGGPYADITGSTSPYTNTISGSSQFFRVKVTP